MMFFIKELDLLTTAMGRKVCNDTRELKREKREERKRRVLKRKRIKREVSLLYAP